MPPEVAEAPTTKEALRPPQPKRKPKIGHTVIAWIWNPATHQDPWPATVLAVKEDGFVAVNIHQPGGFIWDNNMPYSDVPKLGHWTWQA